jgi:hypothetical protein
MAQIQPWLPEALFAVFLIWAFFAFYRWRGDVALCAVVVTGWLLLPIAPKGQYVSDTGFPYWLIGLALPSHIGLSKAVVIGLAGLLGSLSCQLSAWRGLRPSWLDLPIFIWCLWPLSGIGLAVEPSPSPVFSAGYLLASWGALWVLARVHLGTAEGQLILVRALALGTVACLPFAILEGIFNMQLYSLWVEPHPFAEDGRERYAFFRPIGFFEHGNQYGTWVGAGVVSAYAVMVERGASGRSRLVLAIAVTVAVLAQSVSALVLAVLCIATRHFWMRWRLGRVFGVITVGLVLLSAIYLSGALPIERIARDAGIGQKGLQVFRAMGRGSLPWRISQDQKTLPLVKQHPIVGNQQWDWWRPANTRPWGLVMLALGQFGLVGVVAMLLTWLLPAVKSLRHQVQGGESDSLRIFLGLTVMMIVVDALMNSFMYFPVLLIAGALAGRGAPVRLGSSGVGDRPRTSGPSQRPLSLSDFPLRR